MSEGDGHWVSIPADDKTIDELHNEILERFIKYMDEEVDKNDLSKMANSLFMSHQWRLLEA